MTFSSGSVSPGKSLVSWWAAADSERRSWPTAWTRVVAACWSIRAPMLRASLITNEGYSEALSSADFTSVTGPSLRSLVSTPLPFWPPLCTSTSATSSAGAAQ